MLNEWQLAVKECRQSKQPQWQQAYSILETVMATATGPELGRAVYEYAYTKFSQDAANAPEALDFVKKALDMAGYDYELQATCYITGINYALYASDLDEAKEMVNGAGRLIIAQRPEATPWHAHMHIWCAYYWRAKGNSRFAVKSLRDAIKCADAYPVPNGNKNNGCTKRVAMVALGDSLWTMGLREEAMREMRKAMSMMACAGEDAIAYVKGRIAHGEGRMDDAIHHLRRAFELCDQRDHLFQLRIATALVSALCEAGRSSEANSVLQPFKQIAMRGWMTRVLVRLQRLGVRDSEKGGEMVDEGD